MPITPSPLSAGPPGQPLWLIRPRSDGGSDYVNFVPSQPGPGTRLVEIREGSHLPPQMPLLKRRRRLDPLEAEDCRRRLQQEAGFHHSEPLF
jgi:hypothetical protein